MRIKPPLYELNGIRKGNSGWYTIDSTDVEALARGDLNWSIMDLQLYCEAFTGQARSITGFIYHPVRFLSPG